MDERERETLAQQIAQEGVAQAVDVPLSFHYDSGSQSLQVAFPCFPLIGGHVATMRLVLTPAATAAVIQMVEHIQANPGQDVEGSASAANRQ